MNTKPGAFEAMPLDVPMAQQTLRDWFAGLAMQALARGVAGHVDAAAREAYLFADAMLKARQQ